MSYIGFMGLKWGWGKGTMDGVVLWTPSILNLNFEYVLLTGWYPYVNTSFFPRFKTISYFFEIRSKLREIQTPVTYF